MMIKSYIGLRYSLWLLLNLWFNILLLWLSYNDFLFWLNILVNVGYVFRSTIYLNTKKVIFKKKRHTVEMLLKQFLKYLQAPLYAKIFVYNRSMSSLDALFLENLKILILYRMGNQYRLLFLLLVYKNNLLSNKLLVKVLNV